MSDYERWQQRRGYGMPVHDAGSAGLFWVLVVVVALGAWSLPARSAMAPRRTCPTCRKVSSCRMTRPTAWQARLLSQNNTLRFGGGDRNSMGGCQSAPAFVVRKARAVKVVREARNMERWMAC